MKLNFLALDFDQTVLDIHTGGVWKGRIDELCTHVRPLFRQLIVTAHSANMKIAIVTFSPQVNHIIEVLETHFPNFANDILIRGRDHSWAYEGNGMKAGKQPFMASAAEEFEEKYPSIEITRNTTLLVDDDANNIRLALKDGVRAIWFNPNDSDILLQNMIALQ